MIHQNLELHNCAEIVPGDGYVALQRVPELVRTRLNPGAQEKMLRPASSEIRFALEPGKTARVTLSSAGQVGVVPFFGDHRFSPVISVGQKPRTIELAWSDRLLRAADLLREQPHRFDPGVVRLLSWGDQVRFHGAEGEGIRPPAAAELPRVRYLSYGTSITHGSAAIAAHLTYVAQTARRIGADLLNFGVGGSCHCEPELADYFAERDDWDVATLALSVNMMAFTAEEFQKRVRYLVHTVAGSNPRRPVVCLTIYRYHGDLMASDDNHNPDKVSCFRQILRDAVQDCPTPNTHLVEGPEILRGYGGLTCDLIHPADGGMIEMGENLARVLQPLVG